MRRVIITTVGTSLLTNRIDRTNLGEQDWYSQLSDYANESEKNTSQEVKEIISKLKERAVKRLKSEKTFAASAELNGIYAIYQKDLSLGKNDLHFLISTDTFQGITAAEIIKNFLQEQGIGVNIYTPPDLSTASSEAFSWGIDNLITWLEETLPAYQQQYKICFNLVGSFKSLQGYLNTIGMFYADEIIYIFEGKRAELITIPRLPITIDTAVIENHKESLASLYVGVQLSQTEVEGIPEALLNRVGNQVVLSTWGKLITTRCLDQLIWFLPHLNYRDSFFKDYQEIRDKEESNKLRQVLVKISGLLVKSRGDTSVLKGDGGVLYEKYKGRQNIEHLRVTQGTRISCHGEGGKLTLYHYGKEEIVNRVVA